MFIVDVFRAHKFIQSLNPLRSARDVSYVQERWASAGYTTKVREVAPVPTYTVPFADLEGLHSESWYR